MTDWTLKKHAKFAGMPGPVLVCVMDGVGIGNHDEGDAVWLARTPSLDFLAQSSPTTQLIAHGTAVGMPSDADMGNSEVGHNALGAGRRFDQGAKLVDQAITSGALFAGDTWKALVARCIKNERPLHFVGLLSDGNVHSHIKHLLALIARADVDGVARVRVHVLLDGRDVSETSALEYVDALEQQLATLNRKSGRDYRIASGGGRQTTTMDRYNADWRIVERGWQAHVLGTARPFKSTSEAIETFRAEKPGVIDQDLPSFTIVGDDGQPVGTIEDGSAVVLFNFRGDRAIELAQAFEKEDLREFDRVRRPNVLFAGMMEYDGDLHVPAHYLVTPPTIEHTLGEYLVRNQLTQLATSETQKFGHVTYFWNGNRTGMFDAGYEKYVEVPSDRVSFDERPWMKAADITEVLLAELKSGKNLRHARFNYANGDMVGHTGKLDAAVVAVEAVDLCIGRLLPVIAELQGALIVTADHGNADEMYERDGKTKAIAVDKTGRRKAKTSHTLNPVPFHVYAPSVQLQIDQSIQRPTLANVAATTLQLMGYEPPKDFDPGLLKF